MTSKVAVCIANYNMPESADALCEYIERHTCWPTDLYLVDNASDLVPEAVHTNVRIKPHNKQTTAAWLEGLKEANQHGPYFAYVFCITSTSFPEGIDQDPISPLAEFLESDPNAVGVHAALTPDSTTSWTHLISRYGGNAPRRTYMIDNIFAMYRAEWFDGIGRFDPELRYAWGVDLETCWHARRQGRSLWVHEGVRVRKVTDIAYQMERMRMSADERRHLAGQNMEIILSRKYGPTWWSRMTNEFVEPEWR
jgi:hypothetical protein